MTRVKAKHDALREQGAADFCARKPIGAFYDLPASAMPNGRHNELARGSYEVGWRAAADDYRAAASRAKVKP